MLIDWDKHMKIVEHWRNIYKEVYDAVKDKEYRFIEPLYINIKTTPSTYKQYKLETICAYKNDLIGKCIKFKLTNDGLKSTIEAYVYPQFELKSGNIIVNEEVVFEIIKDQLKKDGLIKDTIVTTETVII